MIGVAEKAAIGECTAVTDIERNDLVLGSGLEARHLAPAMRLTNI